MHSLKRAETVEGLSSSFISMNDLDSIFSSDPKGPSTSSSLKKIWKVRPYHGNYLNNLLTKHVIKSNLHSR